MVTLFLNGDYETAFRRHFNNLSEGKKHNNDSDAAEKIFDDLKRLFLETHD